MPQKLNPTVRTVEWTPPDLETYYLALNTLEEIIEYEVHGPDDKFEDAKERFRRLPGYPNYPDNYHIQIVKPKAKIITGAN